MKKLVSTRQLIFILIISLMALKFLYLPSLLAKEFANTSFIFVFIMLVLDFLVFLILLYLYNKNPNLSFFDLLKKIFGSVIARVIMFLLFIFFFLKCWGIFQTNFSYLNENLYTSLKWYVFSVPILITVFFIAKFGVNSYARAVEFLLPIIFIGFVISLCVGINRADFSNLLPLTNFNFGAKLGGIFKYSYWFGDYLIFIVFFGNVKEDKNFNKKVSITFIVSIFVVTLFVAVSYAVFSYNAVSHTNAISDIIHVLPSTSDIGSFDWVLILIWDMNLFLYFALNCLGAFYSFRQAFFKKWQGAVIFGILFLVFILSLLSNFDIIFAINLAKNYFWYFCIPIQYGLPVLLLIFSYKVKRRKANEIG